MDKIILKNPKKLWKLLGKRSNWIQYILPKRSEIEFWKEGELEAEHIKKYISDNSFVIDYGCGIGRITKPLEKHCKKIIGLDICKKFVERAGKGFQTIDEFKEKNVASFIFSISVLQHNDHENRVKIIKNIHSLLKEGGKCFINFPVKGYIYEGRKESWFVSVFEEDYLKDLFKDFSEVKLIKGNLVNYGKEDIEGDNEIFVLATK